MEFAIVPLDIWSFTIKNNYQESEINSFFLKKSTLHIDYTHSMVMGSLDIIRYK